MALKRFHEKANAEKAARGKTLKIELSEEDYNTLMVMAGLLGSHATTYVRTMVRERVTKFRATHRDTLAMLREGGPK